MNFSLVTRHWSELLPCLFAHAKYNIDLIDQLGWPAYKNNRKGGSDLESSGRSEIYSIKNGKSA